MIVFYYLRFLTKLSIAPNYCILISLEGPSDGTHRCVSLVTPPITGGTPTECAQPETLTAYANIVISTTCFQQVCPQPEGV